jgi:hypothetical protein
MPFTVAYAQSQLNHIAGTTYPAAPGTVYLALFKSMPDTTGSNGVEATGTRTAVTLGSPAVDIGGQQAMSNSATVTQTIATACWIVGYGLYTASTAGTLIYQHTFPSGFQVTKNQSVVIPVGAVSIVIPFE